MAIANIEEMDYDSTEEAANEMEAAKRQTEDVLARLRAATNDLETVWDSEEAREYKQQLNDIDSKHHLFTEEMGRYASNAKTAVTTARAAASVARKATIE